MDKTYVITVPNSPKSVNAGGGGVRVNHFAGHKEKKKWQGLFLLELMTARVPKHMEFCALDITVRFKHKSGGKGRDEENFRYPVVKPLADALVEGGYIKDDTAEWLKVTDFRVEDAPEWSQRDPRVKSEMVVKLEASYLD